MNETTGLLWAAHKLEAAYLMAEKYQLNLLKALTVTKFRTCRYHLYGKEQTVADCPTLLLIVGQYIYDRTLESDVEFRAYFKDVAPDSLFTDKMNLINWDRMARPPDGSFNEDIRRAALHVLSRQNRLLAEREWVKAHLRKLTGN